MAILRDRQPLPVATGAPGRVGANRRLRYPVNSQLPEPRITGASQGIGAGLTKAYRERGYAVIATARSIGPSHDSGIVAAEGDIADPDTAQRIVDAAIERFGRIDTLINNAGIYIGKPFTDYTLDDFNAQIAVNLAGFFHITTRTIGHMLDQRRGHVVNVSTTLVEQADSGQTSRPARAHQGGPRCGHQIACDRVCLAWSTGKCRLSAGDGCRAR